MAKHGNDMIYAVSMNAKRPRKKPVKVARKLIGTAAWKNHAMKEVPDPSIKVQPITPLSAPDPSVMDELAKLRAENEALKAKQFQAGPIITPDGIVEPVATGGTQDIPSAGVTATTTKRPPGRPKKDQTQA